MSKKNKVSSGKKAKNKVAKASKEKKAKAKPVSKSKDKKAAKPKAKQVKKPAPKKPIAKKAAPKKPVKAAKPAKVTSKNTKVKAAKKASTVKKITSKKITTSSKSVAKGKSVKKIVKVAPSKKIAAKPVAKKVVAKVSKPVKPAKTAKVVAKVTPAKASKPVEVKKVNTVPSKPEPKPVLKKAVETPDVEKTISTKNSDGSIEVLAITNNIPVQVKQEISTSKINSISSSITNPVKTNDAYAVKFEKEPNGKYELEFVVKSSADLLFEFLYTSSGLSEWFCDDVNIRNGIYTFVWDGQLQQARLLKTIENQLVRFQWVDKVDGSYFEFRIQKDELTNDISLIITDFAENTQDANSSKLLWQSQVDKLLHVIGSIF